MPQDFVLYELVLEGHPVYVITRGDDALRGKMGLRTDHGELFIQGSANNRGRAICTNYFADQTAAFLLLNLHNQDVFVPNYRELA